MFCNELMVLLKDQEETSAVVTRLFDREFIVQTVLSIHLRPSLAANYLISFYYIETPDNRIALLYYIQKNVLQVTLGHTRESVFKRLTRLLKEQELISDKKGFNDKL
eukprot:snap_masked-scaffold_36-processed-gene-2.104-mRNA-1 protein AED:1.00 eAED:1.00 QI:0/0/0/0/1/1/2/0/106